MKRIQVWVRAFFGFSRAQTNGFMVLIPLMFVLLFSQTIYRYCVVYDVVPPIVETVKVDSIVHAWHEDDAVIKIEVPHLLRVFNPNKASKEELVTLGFTQQLAERLINYRTKIGALKIKSDLKRLYGMDSTFYLALYNYIDLPEKFETSPKKEKATVVTEVSVQFDINKADTIQLKSIRGIGTKLSARIIKYREKLGGFVALTQLSDVWGLDSTALKNLVGKTFVEPGFEPQKININSATESELSGHPYIGRKLANAITSYRFQHGTFNGIDDLKAIVLIDERTFEKIRPYLSIK